MTLFRSGETKEEKQARKERELMMKFGLDGLSDYRDISTLKEIASCLTGNKLIETGVALGGNGVESSKLSYFRILMLQNNIIIRQLERLNKNLEQLNQQ